MDIGLLEPQRFGVVLLHGFTSTPASMAHVERGLSRHGVTTSSPLLPGHGTSWQDLAVTPAESILQAATESVTDLRKRCDYVVPVGLSMGGALALYAAARQHTDAVSVINPGLWLSRSNSLGARLLHRIIPTAPAISGDIARDGVTEESYDRTPLRAVVELAQIFTQARGALVELRTMQTPVTLMLSQHDHVLGRESANMLRRSLTRAQLRTAMLQHSYHVATLDHDQDLIVHHIIRQLHGLENPSSPGDSPNSEMAPNPDTSHTGIVDN